MRLISGIHSGISTKISSGQKISPLITGIYKLSVWYNLPDREVFCKKILDRNRHWAYTHTYNGSSNKTNV